MKNQVVLITGGAGGIGSSIAYALKDYKLVITEYSSEVLNMTVTKMKADGLNVIGYKNDITDEASLPALFDFVLQQGELKGVVHTAGVSGSVNDAKIVFDINLLGTYNLVEEFYNIAPKDSVIIVLSSMMGHMIPANAQYDKYLLNPKQEGAFEEIARYIDGSADTMYNFTKRGVLLITKDNTMRMGKKGARIVSISPGVIMTPMAKKALKEHSEIMKATLDNTPLKRYGAPEDVANAVGFLLSDKANFITGTDLIIDGGITGSRSSAF